MTTTSFATRHVHADVQRLALAPATAHARLLGILRRAIPFDAGYLVVLDPLSGWPVALETLGVPPASQATWFFTHPMLTGAAPGLPMLARSRRHVRRLMHPAHDDIIHAPYQRAPEPAPLQGVELRAAFARKGLLWGGVSLVRRPGVPGFDEREEAFLEEIAPIVGEILQAGALRHEASQPRPGESPGSRPDGPGVVCIHRGGAVSLLTPATGAWLHQLDGDRHHRGPGGLPEVLWLAVSALEHAPRDQPRPVVHMQGQSGTWITVEAFRAPSAPPGQEGGDTVLVIGPSSADEIVVLRERLYGLSEREQQIADLVIRGLSTRQISAGLAIAESTVQGHLTHIFEKVQVSSRRALVQRLLIDQLFASQPREAIFQR